MSNQEPLKEDNPAARFYNFVNKAKGMGNGHSIQKLVSEWNLASEGDTKGFHSRILAWYETLDEMESRLLAIENINHQRYFEPMPRFRQALDTLLPFNDISAFLGPIQPSDLTVLAFWSDELSKHHTDAIIQQDELDELLADIDSLSKSLRDSALPAELKNIILEQTEIIRRSIFEYRIGGAKRLREALATSVGTLLIHYPLFEEEEQKEEVSKFKMLLRKLNTVVEYALKLKALAEPVIKLLSDRNPPTSPSL